ncbi:response regulator [Aestuariispira insulae]|uniref:Response regulator receiver domain-containing protein n=1 Tax=Aestuariispira insulae TaxID=1461337 RepID=A0A3D9HVY2_9PROT|nr:response regulator [Aestuariispira insulae]RED53652.1 response regulator receiver domain-containing protein [Aestuariispira insulae]
MAIETYDDQVEAEYLEETRDVLSEMDVILEQLANGSEEGRRRFDVLIGKLQALCVTGRHTRHALLNVTMHRLMNYLDGISKPSKEQMQDVQIFSDTMTGILDGSIQHDGWDFSEFVRSLPVRRPMDIEDLEHLDIEVMLVEGKRSAARLFERELRACGYRVTSVRNPLEAISLAVRMRPDLIIASAELDDIGGVDLGCAIAAMPSTKNIPFAVLTSYDRNHKALADLPENAAVMNKGSRFGEDLADVLEQFKIT